MVNFELLAWDTEFFGFKVARIPDQKLSGDQLATIFENLKKLGIRLVYFASTVELLLNQSSISLFNGILVDRKITYKKEIVATNQADQHISSFQKGIDDEEILIQLAIEAGEFSRFNTDPNIDKNSFQKLFRLWMENALAQKTDTHVLVYKEQNEICGMVTLKLKDGIGNIDLIAVRQDFRGRGMGKKLLIAAETNLNNKTDQVSVVTQSRNSLACRLYESFGFELANQVYFYHFWLK
ncbi:MAG: GNAT family N-acetyltransferase [Flammeovirgaceae bacterium]|nr:GNAT family N-acetyltransferase [Flammeovirgaceae bacterium]